jgi:hypothetical protein
MPQRVSRSVRYWLMVPLAYCLLLAGCGGSTAEVSGIVIYEGSPLKGGNISFVTVQGGHSVTSAINEDGTYTLTKAPVGEVKVVVETRSLEQVATRPRYSAPSDAVGYKPPDSGDAAKRFVAIPAKYQSLNSTDLMYTVVKGKQKKDFTLEGMVMPTKDPAQFGGTYQAPKKGTYDPEKMKAAYEAKQKANSSQP